ncbi:MAG: RND family transporter [Desulfobulbaceae bacterium]|nr:MAG: RND family transporter [Desulfobulbaceae bacterium]
MASMKDKLINGYNRLVIDRPEIVIALIVIFTAILGYQAQNFRIDASTETLLLENDEDLRYTREISGRYEVQDFLIIAYSPRSGELLDSENLETITSLRDELLELETVESVLSILDVPLLASPPISLKQFTADGIPTLTSPEADKELAKVEFSQSHLYRDLLVSRDLETTALIVYLKTDPEYAQLIKARNEFIDKKADGTLNSAEAVEYQTVVEKIRSRQVDLNAQQNENIKAVRAIMAAHRDNGELILGGISMIADDLITYIKNDLKIFGVGVFLLLVLMLGLFFRSKRWIFLPMLCCFISMIAMMGLLGTFGWDVTVISSNFISLQLIITLAISVHLVVRYREYQVTQPDLDQRSLVRKTMRSKFIPCLYAVLTTVAGFISLLLSDIKPVINFGWMMSGGILISLVVTFLLFPAGLMMVKKPATVAQQKLLKFSLTAFLAKLTDSYGRAILVITLALCVFTVMGISRLRVENSFIDYFKESTEIYRGMKIIDEKLGGTTPLDVIVQFETPEEEPVEESTEDEYEDDFEIVGLDFFSDEETAPQEEDPNKYWFMDHRLETIERVHDYLDNRPETGKVVSLGTFIKIGREINDGKSLDSFDMAVVYTKIPEEYKDLILTPYVSFESNEVRFWLRVKDSLKSLKRDAFLQEVKHDLVHELGLAPEKVRLAGTMVLYNNMLQSLFSSQIKTLSVVALALLVMFLILFRSLKIALIALFPNLLSAGTVLGVMGWLDIPLDMMTITIAAISIGIAVDNTIHYIHRFQEEIPKDQDYRESMFRCHNSIGYAMYYTSVTIIIGFSILMLANFWPTIYFGLFTGLAMLIALLASLTLLPQLLVWLKPFGAAQVD